MELPAAPLPVLQCSWSSSPALVTPEPEYGGTLFHLLWGLLAALGALAWTGAEALYVVRAANNSGSERFAPLYATLSVQTFAVDADPAARGEVPAALCHRRGWVGANSTRAVSRGKGPRPHPLLVSMRRRLEARLRPEPPPLHGLRLLIIQREGSRAIIGADRLRGAALRSGRFAAVELAAFERAPLWAQLGMVAWSSAVAAVHGSALVWMIIGPPRPWLELCPGGRDSHKALPGAGPLSIAAWPPGNLGLYGQYAAMNGGRHLGWRGGGDSCVPAGEHYKKCAVSVPPAVWELGVGALAMLAEGGIIPERLDASPLPHGLRPRRGSVSGRLMRGRAMR